MGKIVNTIVVVFLINKVIVGVVGCVRFISTYHYYNAAVWALVFALISLAHLVTTLTFWINGCHHSSKAFTAVVLVSVFCQIASILATITYVVLAISHREKEDTDGYHGYLWAAGTGLACWISSLIFTIRSIHFRRIILNTLYDQQHGGSHGNNDDVADDSHGNNDDVAEGSDGNNDVVAEGSDGNNDVVAEGSDGNNDVVAEGSDGKRDVVVEGSDGNRDEDDAMIPVGSAHHHEDEERERLIDV